MKYVLTRAPVLVAILAVILSVCINFMPLSALGQNDSDQNDASFWDQTRTGANAFNKQQTEAWFEDASDLGVSWVRLAFDKWESKHRDFLVGDADNYQGLVEEDFAKLEKALDWADGHNLKVVLSPLTLPGARYRQNNGFKYDSRLWRDPAFADQANRYWFDLVTRLKNHPAVAAYNIINEPAPELGTGLAEHGVPGNVERFMPWYETHKNTPADLYAFYSGIIKTIRSVDPKTMIMVDAGWYAQPTAFTYWPGPLPDHNVLYAFHMYEPFDFTSNGNFKNKKNFVYPGIVPFAGKDVNWNRDKIRAYLAPFYKWAEQHKIAPSRLVAGEFGCMRRNKGCAQYLRDVIDVFDENETHWAFYSFREDEWDGYDYEVGTGGLPWDYWKAVDRGEKPEVPRSDTDIFLTIKSKLK
ncbi:glycoside hydrolase family 5 protein [Kiloniella majae]|uniref:glycoside hydrolase family 5 protein n=1 Tax=Kiloniella majae TaxID=1938558 RepID=UPI001C3F5A79|nr:cellulase family glycosylhydrolase [Kiloniella majae]